MADAEQPGKSFEAGVIDVVARKSLEAASSVCAAYALPDALGLNEVEAQLFQQHLAIAILRIGSDRITNPTLPDEVTLGQVTLGLTLGPLLKNHVAKAADFGARAADQLEEKVTRAEAYIRSHAPLPDQTQDTLGAIATQVGMTDEQKTEMQDTYASHQQSRVSNRLHAVRRAAKQIAQTYIDHKKAGEEGLKVAMQQRVEQALRTNSVLRNDKDSADVEVGIDDQADDFADSLFNMFRGVVPLEEIQQIRQSLSTLSDSQVTHVVGLVSLGFRVGREAGLVKETPALTKLEEVFSGLSDPVEARQVMGSHIEKAEAIAQQKEVIGQQQQIVAKLKELGNKEQDWKDRLESDFEVRSKFVILRMLTLAQSRYESNSSGDIDDWVKKTIDIVFMETLKGEEGERCQRMYLEYWEVWKESRLLIVQAEEFIGQASKIE